MLKAEHIENTLRDDPDEPVITVTAHALIQASSQMERRAYHANPYSLLESINDRNRQALFHSMYGDLLEQVIDLEQCVLDAVGGDYIDLTEIQRKFNDLKIRLLGD